MGKTLPTGFHIKKTWIFIHFLISKLYFAVGFYLNVIYMYFFLKSYLLKNKYLQQKKRKNKLPKESFVLYGLHFYPEDYVISVVKEKPN